MAKQLCTKVTPEMSRQEKEQVVYNELMLTDRVFVKNCREMDLFNDFGRETSIRFIIKIEKQEEIIKRKLNAPEIEEIYQKTLEGLKNQSIQKRFEK